MENIELIKIQIPILIEKARMQGPEELTELQNGIIEVIGELNNISDQIYKKQRKSYKNELEI
ncbi:MAG TPA: hypothetical protein VK426_09415 [Methanobacterium sp.]|nr:hypothetical protein [Methanobacterium sp.]